MAYDTVIYGKAESGMTINFDAINMIEKQYKIAHKNDTIVNIKIVKSNSKRSFSIK